MGSLGPLLKVRGLGSEVCSHPTRNALRETPFSLRLGNFQYWMPEFRPLAFEEKTNSSIIITTCLPEYVTPIPLGRAAISSVHFQIQVSCIYYVWLAESRFPALCSSHQAVWLLSWEDITYKVGNCLHTKRVFKYCCSAKLV